jgi:hypothetical protein
MKWLILIFLVSLGGCGVATYEEVVGDENYSTPTPDLSGSTVQELADWVGEHTIYETNQQQFGTDTYWETPAETLASGHGDCKAMAILLLYLAHKFCAVDGTLVKESDGGSEDHVFPKVDGVDYWALPGYSPVREWTYAEAMWIAEKHLDE